MESRKSKNTFILGLGFQKCGTSWLHSYLQQSRKYEGGDLKEYHIWDALDIPLLSYNKIEKPGIFSSLLNKNNYLRYNMQTNNDSYYDYFESIFSNTVSITGDITPSYSGLKKSRLRSIYSNFQERNIACKAIILLRDPVDRIKSAVRYNLDRGNYDEGIESGEINFLDALKQYYRTEHCSMRTRYNDTIDTVMGVFSEEDLYIGIYEEMFETQKIDSLSNFVGVQARYDFANVRVNKTKSATIVNRDIEEKIKLYYNEVYEYCNEAFPSTRNLWR
ncbi:MAG: hypothetical protein CMA21_04065 [Euryarchaeota archaeon]|nr:hypothetical protein [Euryarchaeota archaeon]|tara:strand:+ start:12360 stop:13187 length:828 start_codon:yes stop_codon:yes gene_type:complete